MAARKPKKKRKPMVVWGIASKQVEALAFTKGEAIDKLAWARSRWNPWGPFRVVKFVEVVR